MDDITIRVVDDVPAAAEIIIPYLYQSGFDAGMRAATGGRLPSLAEAASYVRTRFAGLEKRCILIERSGEVVGICLACIRVERDPWSSGFGKQILRIEHMIVSEMNRGCGIGSVLMSFVLGYAKESGCVSAELDCVDSNVSVKRFCERNGFASVVEQQRMARAL